MDPIDALRRIAFLLESMAVPDIALAPFAAPPMPSRRFRKLSSSGWRAREGCRRSPASVRLSSASCRRCCRTGRPSTCSASKRKRWRRPWCCRRRSCTTPCAATATRTRTGRTAFTRSRRWRARRSSSAREYIAHRPLAAPYGRARPESGALAGATRRRCEAERGAGAVSYPHRHRGRHPRGRRALDQEDEFLERLDVVVGSAHSLLRMEPRA